MAYQTETRYSGDTGGGKITGGDHGTNGPQSNAGERQVTRGGSVRSGLSEQAGFYNESLESLGQDNKSGARNQVPCQPKSELSTDRGKFTCW
jgi:hypothetical protein